MPASLPQRESEFAKPAVDAKRRSVRGGVTTVLSQGLKFTVRTGSMMVMARLLSPEDFGLQGMVVAMTGFLSLFRDAGLSAVTVQRADISREQVSTLFWINVLVGALLTLSMLLAAPAIAAFYHDPRLVRIAAFSAPAFLINSLSVQHSALLQRQMRFLSLAAIEVVSLAVSSLVGLILARAGYGYWALVAMTVILPLATTVLCWGLMPWMPGLPRRNIGIRSMLSMGSMLMINGLVVYFAYNTEKILLGRFWGPEALGIYGRAYQLISLPSDLLISAIATVAFPSLASLQKDPDRLQRAFLRGYSVALSLTIPTTVCCALFAGQIVGIVLGPKWNEAAQLFRFMTPTILAFGFINPLAWFLISSGRVQRSMYISFLIAPVVILGAVVGVHYGPRGAAIAFSSMMTLLTVPVIAWARAGTTLSGRALWTAIRDPLAAGCAAAVCGFVITRGLPANVPVIVVAFVGALAVYSSYAVVLCYPLKQRDVYVDLFRQVAGQGR
jgi:PST family polysaccharide transporter